MEYVMKYLFSPYRIKNLELINRIVAAPLASFVIADDGSVTDQTVEHYKMRASGGAAMVIMEACAISPEGIVSAHQARIDKDQYIEGLSKIAEVIRSEGAIPALQLHHAGRQTPEKVINEINDLKQQIKDNDQFIAKKQLEIKELNLKYEADLKRFRELKGIIPNNSAKM